MRCEPDGTTTAGKSGMRTHTWRLRALILAALIALGVAALPTACSGPSDGPKPSGGVPSY
ncbi:MAG: hypothetical protein M3P38_03895 [Chloroflexota bacterium]|nr:hypothetical protein [Chloroflexota bacterium]